MYDSNDCSEGPNVWAPKIIFLPEGKNLCNLRNDISEVYNII